MCGLISNVLHNLVRNQQDVTQIDKIKMLMFYVSYQHALTTFEVELSKWEMEVALMCIKTLHTIVVQWEKKTVNGLRRHLGTGIQCGKYLHIINTF